MKKILAIIVALTILCAPCLALAVQEDAVTITPEENTGSTTIESTGDNGDSASSDNTDDSADTENTSEEPAAVDNAGDTSGDTGDTSGDETTDNSSDSTADTTASADEYAPTTPLFADKGAAFDDSILEGVESAMLIDADTGAVLYSKNPDSQVFPASTTKIMTAILAIENDMQSRNVTATVCKDDFSSESSLMGLERGENIPGLDVLYGMLLKSGNDAAATTAIEVGGSVEEFANMMNAKAAELGMTSTHFVNPHGIQDDNHYTTASDMSRLARYAFKNELFMNIVGTTVYNVAPTDMVSTEREVKNTNKLIYAEKTVTTEVDEETGEEKEVVKDETPLMYEYATGMKTGYTPSANGCLVASATKDGMNLIAIIYKDTSEMGQNRWNIAKQMFEYGFNNYKTLAVSDFSQNFTVNQQLTNFATNDAEQGMLKLYCTGDNKITLPAEIADSLVNGTAQVQVSPEISRNAEGPVAEGESFGSAVMTLDGVEIASGDLVASRQVYAQGEENLAGDQTAADASDGAVTDDGEKQNVRIWWWMLIPAGVIVFIIIRAVIVNKRRRRARRMPVAKYNYGRGTNYRRRRNYNRYKGRYR